MPEAQAKQLIAMMDRAPILSRLEVCFPPFEVKRSSLEKLARGDILILPTRQFGVTVLEEDDHIVAHGLYGDYSDTPSILIVENSTKPLYPNDSKKYEILKISLGEIEKRELDQGKIITLYQDKMHDATLYRDKEPIAYASLVQVDKKAALQIGEVK